MVTGVEIGLGIKALKTAFDIAKEAKDLTDTTAMRSKIIEMQSLIMDAQASAIDAREGHATQVERIRQLEEEVADLKAWGREKSRYEMKRPWAGATVYALKESESAGEPQHWLCANCYTQGKKSFLNTVGSVGTDYMWKCPNCTVSFPLRYDLMPK